MSSAPNLFQSIRYLPYNQLKSLYENPENFTSFYPNFQSMIRQYLPKGDEKDPNYSLQNLLIDHTNEVIRAIACPAIQELEEISQSAVLLIASRMMRCPALGSLFIPVPSATERMAFFEQLSPFLLLEAMEEYLFQKKELEMWAGVYKSHAKANRIILKFLAGRGKDFHYGRLNLAALGLSSLPHFISKPGFEGIKILSLAENGLKTFPNLEGLKSLKTLDLSANNLSTFPVEWVGVNSLESLELSGNNISTIPINTTGLDSLRSLSLRYNGMTECPRDLMALRSLQRLDLRNNKIFAIGQRVFFPWSLEELNLRGNHISILPTDLEGFGGLDSIDLSANKITDIPRKLKGLDSLRFLEVAYNDISEIPETIEGVGALEELVIQGNEIKRIPPTWEQKTSNGIVSLKPLFLQKKGTEVR